MWWVYIFTVNRPLTVLFLVCVGVLVADDILFAGTTELFRGGAELSELTYKLCLALASSYLFYFIVVHAKRQRDKETLRPFLYAQTLRLAGEAKNIVGTFKEQSGHSFEGDFPPSEEDVRLMCLALHPYGNSPIITGYDPETGATAYLNWLQYLKYYNERTKDVVTRIYIATLFLDSDHLQVVLDVENGFLVRYYLDQGLAMPMSNTDLTFMTSSLYEYFVKARCAEEYAHARLTLDGSSEPL